MRLYVWTLTEEEFLNSKFKHIAWLYLFWWMLGTQFQNGHARLNKDSDSLPRQTGPLSVITGVKSKPHPLKVW